MDSKIETGKNRGYFVGLVLLLAVSFVLRLILVFRGGQGFWGDESRYNAVYEVIASGDLRAILIAVAGSADHLGFKVVGLIPAFLQLEFGGGYRVATVFFSIISTLNIAWLWLVAKRAGAGQGEAFGAALCFACSNSMFYWSRHLVPYDVALFWGLACLYVALKPEPRIWDSALAGLLGLLTFVTYTGYWTWVALVLAAHVILILPNWRMALLRALCGLAGLAGGFGLLLIFADILGANLWQSYTQFAGTIIQGDFPEGHRVIWEYLWSADSGCTIVWLFAVVAFLAAWTVGLKPANRGWLWFGGVLGVAIVLIVGSNVLEKFVVYGRVVRQMVPFFALLTGYVMFGLRSEVRWIRPFRNGLAVILLLSAAWNFSTPLAQEFPIDFQYRSALEIDRLRTLAQREHRTPIAPDRFRFINMEFIWPIPTSAPVYTKFRELRVSQHPLAYPPFLFEGFKRYQRDAFHKADIKMRLIALEN